MSELTPREQQALQELWGGLSQKEAAARMGISLSRVQAMLTLARRRLGARTMIEAMRKAVQQGALAP